MRALFWYVDLYFCFLICTVMKSCFLNLISAANFEHIYRKYLIRNKAYLVLVLDNPPSHKLGKKQNIKRKRIVVAA